MVGGVVVGFHFLHAYNKRFQSYSNFIFLQNEGLQEV